MALETITEKSGFTVGICASDSSPSLPSLVSFLLSQDEFGPGHRLLRVVVVASGCPEEVLASTARIADGDGRVRLIAEDRRHGKAQALNRILDESVGELLVMLNADAFPERGAVRRLLDVAQEPKVGAVSAMPVFQERGGMLRRSLSLMWSAHSLLSLNLNHAGISNHACDELIVVKRRLMPRLPRNVVNDGAYIGGRVRSKGYLVKFSTVARVNIEVPSLLIDLIRQRRRIIFGHIQVWRKLGRPPKTIESMMFMDPLVSVRTLVRVLSKSPRLITSLPIVLAAESVSVSLGIFDAIRSTDMHAVWRRNAE